jgi:hypothetical protein
MLAFKQLLTFLKASCSIVDHYGIQLKGASLGLAPTLHKNIRLGGNVLLGSFTLIMAEKSYIT